MNSYEREAIGDIVIVRGIVFENTTSGSKSMMKIYYMKKILNIGIIEKTE